MNIEEIKERCSVTLKGQDVNNFETPHYRVAHNDRVELLKEVDSVNMCNACLFKPIQRSGIESYTTISNLVCDNKRLKKLLHRCKDKCKYWLGDELYRKISIELKVSDILKK